MAISEPENLDLTASEGNEEEQPTNVTEGLDLSAIEGDDEQSTNEKERVIKTLKDMAEYLERVKVSNDSAVVNIREPLANLASSMKLLAVEGRPTFSSILPPEIKTNILDRLQCYPSIVIAAAVCQEWRDLLNKKLDKIKVIYLDVGNGVCKINGSGHSVECSIGNVCFEPQHLLEALGIVKLKNTTIVLSAPPATDFNLLAKCLANFKKLYLCIPSQSITNITVTELTEAQVKVLLEAAAKEDTVLEYLKIACIDWRGVVTPQELATLIGNKNIPRMELGGFFTKEQSEVATSIPHVKYYSCHDIQFIIKASPEDMTDI